jgi:RNA polymerase sigma-70 factor (ECF subfamily)
VSVDRAETEQRVELFCRERDFAAAASCALEAYSGEILAYLVARLRSQSDGEEAFSMFAEDLWKGLPAFEFRCSIRGYLYALARNAANRYAVSPRNRAQRNEPLSELSSVSALIERARTATEPYRRTEMKDKIRVLRDELSEEDQLLLMLHVDRALPWRDVAAVMLEDGTALDSAVLDKEAARLRKRFERLKAELREAARKAGLIDS